MTKFIYRGKDSIHTTIEGKDYCLVKDGEYELPENNEYVRVLLSGKHLEKIQARSITTNTSEAKDFGGLNQQDEPKQKRQYRKKSDSNKDENI